MPTYIFEHPKTGETKEVIQTMNEPHVYFEKGLEWKRVFTAARASIDTKVDPFSKKEFVEKTAKKNYKYGEMLEKSAEASEIRKKKAGVDAIQQQWQESYSKTRKGRKHPSSYE